MAQKRICTGLLALWLFGVPVVSSAIPITAVADAYVVSGSPNSNTGSSSQLYMASAGQVGFQGHRAFLKFQNTFSAGTVIGSAFLKVYYFQNVGGGASTISAHAVTDDSWTESGITWNNQPSFGFALDTDSPTLNSYALLDVTSFIQAEITAASAYMSIALTPTANPSGISTQSDPTWALYYSREGTFAPFLDISTAATPEPGTLVLLMLGALALYRRYPRNA